MMGENYSNYRNVCDITNGMSENGQFKIIFILQIYVAPLGIGLNIFMLYLVFKFTTYQTNVKILMANLHLMIIWYSAGLAFKSFHTIKHINSNPCQLVVDHLLCKAVEIPIYIFPLYNTVYALVIIEIYQRLVLWTVYSAEQMKCINPALLFILVSWFFSLIPQVTPFFTMNSTKLMPMCMNLLTLSSSGLFFLIGTAMTIEILAIALCLVSIIWYDEKVNYSAINQARSSLRRRFMILHAMDTNKYTLATFWQCLIWVSFLASLLYLGLDSYITYVRRVILINAAYLFGMIFANIYPVIFLTQNFHLWCSNTKNNRSKEDKSRSPSVNAEECRKPSLVIVSYRQGANDASVHFDYLDSLWSKPD